MKKRARVKLSFFVVLAPVTILQADQINTVTFIIA